MAIKKIPEGYMLYDTWFDKYKPVKNHIDTNASWDGCLFETYGDEDAYVRKVAKETPLKVWTVVDDDYGRLCVTDGWHYVNRVGYLITEVDADPTQSYNVYDDDDIIKIRRMLNREKNAKKKLGGIK